MDAAQASRYDELLPPPALAVFVDRFWVHRIGGRGSEPSVLPDGCIDLVALDDEAIMAGPATRTTTVHAAPHALTVAVQFRIGAAPGLVDARAAELRNQDVPLHEVWGRTGADLAARVVEASDWQARLAALADGLVDRLGRARRPDPVGIGIAGLLTERPGRPLVGLAEEVGLSERQLRRRVAEAVGYSPRTLPRILRFQRFLRAARASGPERSLARLAADAGYADRAHLARESRDLSGLPPAALLDWEAERLAG